MRFKASFRPDKFQVCFKRVSIKYRENLQADRGVIGWCVDFVRSFIDEYVRP